MYLIVVGASPEGQRFIDIALEQKHEVALIEKDEQRARSALQQGDVSVFLSSITDGSVLEEAEVQRAKAIVATTSDDAANLMAMVLAQQYDVPIRLSLLNTPSHRPLFEQLGARVISEPASIIAAYLYQYLFDPSGPDLPLPPSASDRP